ncbi:carbohydrate binding domain-containing protein [Microbacterium amylolyticum]|uniref:Alpha-amylase n=1 Tax=Microbacterium amylolyticum TaxID=936337 RepID=A0ABS4ZJC3_9MICO|nr:carbohydrate binding domain-containing protein [Microbacterium amylolyticum]MBP2437392.1 alpha-amylase [Microbacterium amylolyticum]
MEDALSATGRRRRRRGLRGLAIAGALALAAPLIALTTPAEPAQAAAPGPKDTTAVLFSYTWDAIARECTENLGPAGYGFVQTSPPQEHVLGSEWWTYYQPVSYKLESRLGTEAQFQSMIDTCNEAGVGVIVDVVINHMAGKPEGGVGWAGTPFTHYSYEGTYGDQDFHSCRRDIRDYQSRWEVQECNLVGLSDLNTSSGYVQQTIADYLNDLANRGVAGFRIDAVKHISADDMWGIWNRVENRDSLYVMQEVIRANEPVQPEEYLGIGDIHEFSFGRKLKEAFDGRSLNWLIEGAGIGGTWGGFLPHDDAAVFVDNHDTERNGETLSYRDGAAYDLAQIFTLAWNYGSPSIHSGYSFGGDYNVGPITDGSGRVIDPVEGQGNWTFKHAQNDIANMVGFRNTTYGEGITDKWSNGSNAIAFGRGDKGYVAINRGGNLNRTFTTSLPDGEYYNVITAENNGGTWSGQTVTVSGGQFTTTVPGDGAVAIHVDAMVEEPKPSELTVFYSTDAEWDSYYLDYQIGEGTDGAGSATMAAACEGWVSAVVETNGEDVNASFNDGADATDDNSGAGYILSGTLAAVSDGDVSTQDPCLVPGEDIKVFYSTDSGWSSPYAHYKVGSGSWTSAPGEKMEIACYGWAALTIPSKGADVTAAFNNGAGSWDNNGGQDYVLSGQIAAVNAQGQVSHTDPCDAVTNDLTVFYSTDSGWQNWYAHYKVGSGAWTSAPGEEMTIACWGWASLTIPSDGADVTAAFNNGNGNWDNNGGQDYRLTGQVAAVSANGNITHTNPCS